MSANSATKSAIAGIGQTEFSKNSGRSELQLAAEAVNAALADSGLTPADIDGMVTFTVDPIDEVGLCRCLGVPELRFTTRIPWGGGASAATLMHAASAIASGNAEVVVIWRTLNDRSGKRRGTPFVNVPITAGGGTTFLEWAMPFGAQTPASWEALSAARYMSTYGVTNADFGRLSVIQRRYAATNPAAHYYGKPITLEDHQNSRWIIEPVLRLLDCCQENDGAVAIIVTSLERARDLKQKPVRILGGAQILPFNDEIITNYYHADLAEEPGAATAARQVYRQAGIGAADIQVAMLYDNFTPQVFKQLEAYGFCGLGEARDYIADGHIEIDGRTPVNTHGGLMGEAYIHGVNNIAEAVRQVRGTAANQVKDVAHALVASGVSAAILAKE